MAASGIDVIGQDGNYDVRHLPVPDASSMSPVSGTVASFRNLSPLFYLCTSVVVAGLTLGGGTRQGFFSNSILQLLAIALSASFNLEDR